jgi:tRNA G37 N-methylase Trm5
MKYLAGLITIFGVVTTSGIRINPGVRNDLTKNLYVETQRERAIRLQKERNVETNSDKYNPSIERLKKMEKEELEKQKKEEEGPKKYKAIPDINPRLIRHVSGPLICYIR